MSNTIVGNVYDRIIKEVVETSRVDFEESGIDDSVLEELRSVSRVSFASRRLVGSYHRIPKCDGHFTPFE